jgi:hypothetical protein
VATWRAFDLVEALLAAAILAVLVWAARERTRLRWLSVPDAPTYVRAASLLSRVWRSARRRAVARASSLYLFPSLAVWV